MDHTYQEQQPCETQSIYGNSQQVYTMINDFQNQVQEIQQLYDFYQEYSQPAFLHLKQSYSLENQELSNDVNFTKRKIKPLRSKVTKKLCSSPNTHELGSSTKKESPEDSFDHSYMQGDLEQLVHSIGRESLKLETTVEVKWAKNDFRSSQNQEKFLQEYLNQGQIQKIKNALDDDILHGPQTVAFEKWVESLCKKDNAKVVKEMARRLKVDRYLQKKKGRTHLKKVHYHIRQRVAEERLRVKGRFVNWKQALLMLNETNKKQYNVDDYYLIKNKLTEKYGLMKL